MRRLHFIFRGSFFALAGAAILWGIAAILFPQPLLTVDSGDVKADALVVLGGSYIDRPQYAAELFKRGAAPEIVGQRSQRL